MSRTEPRIESSAESSSDTDSTSGWHPLESVTRHPDTGLVLGGVVLSLVVIPAAVFYLLVVRGPPTTHSGLIATGLLAMAPGLVMGATALWLAARG